jgi:hypothetical protein
VPVLPDELRRLLRAELRAGLTEDGLRHSDVAPLTRLALGLAAITRGPLEEAVLATVYDYLICADTLGHARDGYHDRLTHRLGGGAFLPDAAAAEHQQQQLATLRRNHELEGARDRHRLVEERGRLGQMIDEVIARLDLRRLRDCSTDQRVAARGLAHVLRDDRGNVTAARTWQAMSDAEDQARDPMLRAGELLRQIDQERNARREIQAYAAPVQRSRKPELHPVREAMRLLLDMLPTANGAEQLDTLRQEARQLAEQEPPMSEAERRRRIQALQRKELEITGRLNRHLLDPG